MLKIRLSRIGKKHQPFYRIAVFESHKDPWGNYVEKLGHYNPKTKELKIDKERVQHWIKNGVQLSPTIHNLFVDQKIIEGKKVTVTRISKKRKARMAEKEKGKKGAVKKPDESASAEASSSAKAPEDKPADKEPAEERPKEEAKPKPQAENK